MSAAHGRFGQQDSQGFFPSHLPLWTKKWKWEVKGGRGTEEGKQQDQRASCSSPECFLFLLPVLPPPTPILSQNTQQMLRHIWSSSSSSHRHDSWLSCSPWCHCPLSWAKLQPLMSRGGAGQDPLPGHPRPQPHFSSGLLPALLQKRCWDHLPCPLEWLFTSPNSDLNYKILRWY